MAKKRALDALIRPEEPAEKPPKVEGPPPKLQRGKENDHPIAEQLRQVIRDSGLKQAEIARMANMDHTLIYRFLSGNRDTYGANLFRLMEIFGAEIRYSGPKQEV